MQNGGLVKWEDYHPRLCPCCMGARLTMTEEELEQHITRQMDQERIKTAILNLEIENLKKAVAKVENISGIRNGKGTGQGT